ncbi:MULTISPECIES: hypothetical protein [unclassified Burkholderia]|uniref:hypothetical protein n=1 Tax=unclassified Burkholderia TaxID=2613784 RepID=UPI000A465FB7|nr:MULTISPECIES: hypothetical protein [unclassified Burkholderia]
MARDERVEIELGDIESTEQFLRAQRFKPIHGRSNPTWIRIRIDTIGRVRCLPAAVGTRRQVVLSGWPKSRANGHSRST